VIVKLAIKDILHDWLLSVCLILAVAAIIAPLLILFGLKSGTIQTLRGRLVEDPKNREIRPISSQSFHEDWFDKIQADYPEISFVIPMTRQISTSVTGVSSAGTAASLSLMATAEGDPLLLENGVEIPHQKGCVLTSSAAGHLGIKVGEDLKLRTSRIINGKTENGTLSLRVTGILDERASGLKAAFVRLEILSAVEDYKDGRAVPRYGWPGELPIAYPVYNGAVVFTPQPLGKLEGLMLVNNTGFTNIKEIGAETAIEILGYRPLPEWKSYLVSLKKNAATAESVKAVKNKLRGKGAVVVPWVKQLNVTISYPTDQTKSLKLFAISDKVPLISGLVVNPLFLPDQGENKRNARIMAPGITTLASGQMVFSTRTGARHLSLPISLIPGQQSPGVAFAPASLAGMINLLRYRNITYDTSSDNLMLTRRGYAGFRLYARTIDDVDKVQTVLERQGITVYTQKERIGEVRRLDRYMSLIFWLIATVGVIGAISALTASLYASVERKKRELNILRLLGLLKREIVLFPVSQGLLLSGAGLLLASLVFQLVALVINHLFRSHLRITESLVTLSVTHVVILVAGICLCAVLSAVLAALQAIRLDPAEALRDE